MFDFFFFNSRHARYFFSDLRPTPVKNQMVRPLLEEDNNGHVSGGVLRQKIIEI